MFFVYLQNRKMLEPTCFYKFTKFCQILILTPWFLTLPCSLAKIAQILQKVIVFFLERGEETEPRFWHIWIAQWMKFFSTTAYIFRFRPFSGGNFWSKLDQKYKLWVRLFFINPSIFFQTMLLFARVLSMVRISAILDHMWQSKGPKTSQKGPFPGCWIGTQNFENF